MVCASRIHLAVRVGPAVDRKTVEFSFGRTVTPVAFVVRLERERAEADAADRALAR
jgi:hypothetical protein